MNFDWTEKQLAFRSRIRAVLAENLAEELVAELQEGEAAEYEVWDEHVARFDRAMVKEGWQVADIPPELGGSPMTAIERLILLSEIDYANAPRFMRAISVSVAPAIARFGTDENRVMWLEKLMRGEVTASIGYSEPEAGSDLAALRTRASLDGDHWVINGQKAWNSRGHISTHIWLLARTGTAESRHKGLSMFLVPLDAAGVTVNKVGSWGDHMFNDVFFSDVRIPRDHLVGEIGQGWSIVMGAVHGERNVLGYAYSLRKLLDDLIDCCRQTSFDGEVLISREDVRLALAQFEVDIEIAHLIGMDVACRSDAGEAADTEALGQKIFTSEMRTRLADFATEILGLPGLLSRHDPLAPMSGGAELLYRRAPISRIGAGSNEVLRDVVAQRRLGLPRAR
jgi:alkylation response protein AidB-like acyl-CoA dehydrogenase